MTHIRHRRATRRGDLWAASGVGEGGGGAPGGDDALSGCCST